MARGTHKYAVPAREAPRAQRAPGGPTSPESRAAQALAQFDQLRHIATEPTMDRDLAEKISDQAWTLVETSDPIRVSYAAHLLGVSGPTVRSWIAHGLLEPVKPAHGSRGPLRVTLDSVAEVKEIADELRDLGQDRRLVSAVIARLEGEALSGDDRFRASVAQMRRGERGQWPGGK